MFLLELENPISSVGVVRLEGTFMTYKNEGRRKLGARVSQ